MFQGTIKGPHTKVLDTRGGRAWYKDSFAFNIKHLPNHQEYFSNKIRDKGRVIYTLRTTDVTEDYFSILAVFVHNPKHNVFMSMSVKDIGPPHTYTQDVSDLFSLLGAAPFPMTTEFRLPLGTGDPFYLTHLMIISPTAAHDIIRQHPFLEFYLAERNYNHKQGYCIPFSRILDAASSEDWRVRAAVGRCSYLPEEYVTRLLQDEHEYVCLSALYRLNLSQEQIAIALDSKWANVRHNIASNFVLNEDNLSKALRDSSEVVQGAAMNQPNISTVNLDIAMGSSFRQTVYAAATHPRLSQDQIAAYLKKDSFSHRLQVLLNPNITEKHLEYAMKDPRNEKWLFSVRKSLEDWRLHKERLEQVYGKK